MTTTDPGPTLDETGGGAGGLPPPTVDDGMGEGVLRLPLLGERFSLLVGAPLATNMHRWRMLSSLVLMAFACGPRIEGDEEEAAAAAEGVDAGEVSCQDGPCPLACGDRTCVGALGIGRCIDDECSPVPMECVTQSSTERTCAEVCAAVGEGIVCVANGCEGATAFGYPGTELEAISVCGESTPDVREAVVRLDGPCDAPLAFAGEGSFALYQCCCDHPDY